MKAASLPSVMSPSVVLMGVLAIAVLAIVLTQMKVPLLSNPRVGLVVFLILGMAMCAEGGIGRVAAANQWGHPLSIVGYILGGLILLVAASVFTGLNLPYLQGEPQAILAVAILTGLKMVNSVAHSFLARGGA